MSSSISPASRLSGAFRLGSTECCPPSLEGCSTEAALREAEGAEHTDPTSDEPENEVKPKFRTLSRMIHWHPRTDKETRGFTVREITTTANIAANSLLKAFEDPSRLSLHNIIAIAGMMGESPSKIAAELILEIERNLKSHKRRVPRKRNKKK